MKPFKGLTPHVNESIYACLILTKVHLLWKPLVDHEAVDDPQRREKGGQTQVEHEHPVDGLVRGRRVVQKGVEEQVDPDGDPHEALDCDDSV